MKGLSSKIYDTDYYLNSNLGSEEFKKFQGKKVHERTIKFADLLNKTKGKIILDLGCGKGDLSFELARRGAIVTGIDYSRDGIDLANKAAKIQKKEVRCNINFLTMSATEMSFNENSFDVVTSFDVFEHLYKEELEIVMIQISKILKPGGILLVHTETNKIYLNFTHKFWSYPVSQLLLKINKKITKKNYSGLHKDPRNDLHKSQHVNEPTHIYLKDLFNRHNFINGNINSIVPFKPSISWKDILYNVLVLFYPISKFFPFHLLFATDFVCIETNGK